MAAISRPPEPAQLTSAPQAIRVPSLRRTADDVVALALDPGYLALDVFGAERAGLLAEGLQQAPAVEPALARPAPGAGREILGVQPGKAGFERRRVEEQDIGALRRLEGLVLAQDVARRRALAQ